MKKNIKARGLAIIFVLVSFMTLVSVPAIYTGIQLAAISDDINHYNSQVVKTDEMTILIQSDFEARQELMQSPNPIISTMANNTVTVWTSMFVILGIVPIVLGVPFVYEIAKRLKYV